MSKNYYFIDGAVSAGQSTLVAISSESSKFGIGATTDIEAGIISSQSLSVSGISTLGISTSQSLVVSGVTTTQSLIVSGATTTQSLVVSGVTTTIISGITTIGLGNTSSPAFNSQMSFELTSNTNLRIKVRGTDGVIRSANITLS